MSSKAGDSEKSCGVSLDIGDRSTANRSDKKANFSTPVPKTIPSSPSTDWLLNEGEQADLIRARDWSLTPLGDINEWPTSLRTTVSLCLASNFPINIIWGADAIQIYNSGYRELCGEAHPRAIGESYRITWQSAWPAIGEPFERARLGETSFLKNQRMFLQRNGYLEETFFTFSLSPIRDETGEIVGLFHPVTEMTEAMLSERRLNALRAVAARGVDCDTVAELWSGIVSALTPFRLDLPEFVLFERNQIGEFNLVGETTGVKAMAAVEKWPLVAGNMPDKAVLVKDFVSRFGEIPCGEYPEPIERAFMFPLHEAGNPNTYGMIGVALSSRLPFDESYQDFLSTLGSSINTIFNGVRLRQDAEKERTRLYEVFMQGPLPMVILQGPKHKYTAANAPYEQMVGRKVLGKTVLEAFKNEEVKDFIPLLDGVYQTGTPYIGKALPFSVPDSEGVTRDRFLNVEYHPFRDSNGNIKGIFALHVDVTEERKSLTLIEKSEATFRALAESMPVKVWAAKPTGEMYYYNQIWYDYTGQNFEQAQGDGWAPVIHPDDFALTMKTWMSSVNTGLPLYLELRIKQASDGDFRWHLSRGVAIRDIDGKTTAWFGTITDIHEQKMFSKELSIAKAAAESANATKSSFLANMSHEIRTPLSAILGFTEILKDDETGRDERHRYLNIIDRNGQALVRIIDDILDLSKIEAGKVEIEQAPMCLSELLKDILGMFSDRAQGKGLDLNLEVKDLPDFRIEADAVRIRQVLTNLIGNAIKFTTEGSVTVGGNYELSKTGEIKISITVADTGIGISPEEAKTLFNAFTQADSSTTRRYGGTGLGLALSKKLANAMGGTISISPNENEKKGTNFKIEITAQRSRTTAAEDDDAQVETLKLNGKRLNKWHILVVDDSPDNLILVKIFLGREGAIVDTAADGQQGVEKAMSNNYDVVLMDIQMPELDGYQALAKLRSQNYKKPVFALTAHAMKEERNRILAKGFSGHIAKPVNPAELVSTLLQNGGSSH